MDLYLAAHGQVTDQSRPAACVEYDHNNNGVIDQDEAQAANDDYDAGVIDSDDAIAVVQCYFADPPPTPTPEPPDPLDIYDENENGVIDAEELFRAMLDHFAGRIDRDLALRVFRSYQEGAGASG